MALLKILGGVGAFLGGLAAEMVVEGIFELVGARLKKLFGRRRSPTELDETQALQRHRDREAARQRRI